jgi:hypothetical protein
MGACDALAARPRRAGAAVVRGVIVWVDKGARRRPRRVRIPARRGGPAVSRAHGGVLGEGAEPELQFRRLSGRRGGEGVATRRQRRCDAVAIRVPAQAHRLRVRGDQEAAQHYVSRFSARRAEQMAQTRLK